MYYLILELPFSIMLIFKEKFFLIERADEWKRDHPIYSAFKPYPAWAVNQVKRPIWIPFDSKKQPC